jgi:hypothetical protein
MEREKAREALLKIDHQISIHKQSIASIRQDKQKIKSEMNSIKARKKARLESLQDEISRTNIPQQKKSKRASRDREKKSYDNQIANKAKQIETLDNKILEMGKKIADLNTIKKRIKMEMNKRD